MPIKPKSGETEQDYISRCIGEEISAGYEQDQAAAICYNTWRERMSKMSTQEKVLKKINGIDLTQLEGLEDACWEGYEAIGTKIVDGREVPNCVPIQD